MEATRNSLAIILKRSAYREADLLVTAYTRNFGRLALVARGAKKPGSKLAGHLEPLTLADLMIISGRGRDYVGGAVAVKAFSRLKGDLNKLYFAGRALKQFERLVRGNEKDERLFSFLVSWLEILDAAPVSAKKDSSPENLDRGSGELLAAFFIWKLLAELGYQPEMYQCLKCGRSIEPGKNYFDLKNGGLIDQDCYASRAPGAGECLAISDDCVKLVRFMLQEDPDQAGKMRINKKLSQELSTLSNAYLTYQT